MRIIHTSNMSEPALGVVRQLEAEAKSADNLGIDFDSVLYAGKPVISSIVEPESSSSNNRTIFKIRYYFWLFKKSRQYDLILLRYSVYDPFQLLFILLSKKLIYTVHHTLEVPELSVDRSLKTITKTLLEKVIGPISLSMVDGIVAVLPEILDYEMNRRLLKRDIPGKVYSNGIDYYDRVQFDYKSSRNNAGNENWIPQFLFVSSVFSPWQGLEELVADAKDTKANFTCHVVGELTQVQHELLEKDPRFISYGLKNKEFIEAMISQCDVGLSILAANKKNMDNIPALKVREYLMNGLAVYAGHGDLLPDDFEYFEKGDISINKIVSFAMKHKNNDRKLVSETSRPFIEKELLLEDLYRFIVGSNTNKNQ